MGRRRARGTGLWVAALMLGPLLSGCFPWVVPPTMAVAGPGFSLDERGSITPVIGGRIGGLPLQGIRGQRERDFDLGLGYAFEIQTEASEQARNRHGLFLSGDWIAHRQPLGVDGGLFRVYLGGTLDLVVQQRLDGVGGGATLHLGIDLTGFLEPTSFADGNSNSDAIVLGGGVASGEGGAGLELWSGFHGAGDSYWWSAGLALVVRLPATAGGVAVIPLDL